MPTTTDTLTAINEVPLPEVQTSVELEATLKRVYEEGLPGFVIRAAGLVDTQIQTHEAITHAVIDTLSRTTGQIQTFGLFRPRPLEFGMGQGLSDLHHDMSNEANLSRIRVHRTLEGEGGVILANAGRLVADHYLSPKRQVPGDLTQRDLDLVDELFASGHVNPRIIDPLIYSTHLRTGDTVVFPVGLRTTPTHNKSGPVWHRFDTATATRKAKALIIQPLE